MQKKYDAVVVGSGPNGLSAAIALAQRGEHTLLIEGAASVGGGTRTEELTLPGFHHDFCSAVHPTGILSPFWQQLPLEQFGLEWIPSQASVAHPLDGEEAVLLTQSLEATMDNLGQDGVAWSKLVKPFIERSDDLLADSLKPLGLPKSPFLLARFGLKALWPATTLAKWSFKGHRAKALFAGCAAHSVLPLDMPFSSAIGLMFAVMGHVVNWPVAKGGSQAIADSLAAYFRSLGGEIEVNNWIESFDQLPVAKRYFFDTDPRQLANIAAAELPAAYRRRLQKYNYGPGVFKLDYALQGSIPWQDARCLKASTVHVGGTIEEIAVSEKSAWKGKATDRPFVMVCQQSEFDAGRAPAGHQTGYAYCHVPHASTRDWTPYIEGQIERFAPGFKALILAKKATTPKDFQSYNPNYLGGAITGGAADITQLFTRPVARLNPYSTPNPKIFICSASTPPGGGVHGMCGYHAVRLALGK
ncbi:MAG: NAD(P)/FAD-dependent oxidoreductase [Saprospiraceae bacterium]|nr:NAD(P)/FAD-dependent oxidoreductase [Saprospiraceae bacterium]